MWQREFFEWEGIWIRVKSILPIFLPAIAFIILLSPHVIQYPSKDWEVFGAHMATGAAFFAVVSTIVRLFFIPNPEFQAWKQKMMQQRALADELKRQEEIKALLPSIEEFFKDTALTHYTQTQHPLNKKYITRIVKVFSDVYEQTKFYTLPDPHKALTQYRAACLDALSDFSARVNSALLETPTTQAPFYITHKGLDFLLEQDKDIWKFKDGQQDAFDVLAKPFRETQPIWKELGIKWQ